MRANTKTMRLDEDKEEGGRKKQKGALKMKANT